MLDFGLTKRCNCPQRLWTKGCPHSWHYAFKWKRERFRSALDDVLRRHVDSKTEALREVEKIYDAVRAGAFGVKSAAQTLGELGDIYFEKCVSPKTGKRLGPNERYRWNVMMKTAANGGPLGRYLATDVRKHHVEAFVDANRMERTETVVDAKGKTYQAKRGGPVSTNRCIGRLKAFYNWAMQRAARQDEPPHARLATRSRQSAAGARC